MEDLLMAKLSEVQKRRLDNYLLNAQETLENKQYLKSKPIHILLPTSSTCNLKCRMCFDRSRFDNSQGYIFEDFLKYVHVLDRSISIGIYGWGEPLINPEYDRMLDYITTHFPGIQLKISSNGTLISEKWRQKLVSIKNCFLNISINAASKETYKKIMGADLFETVCHHLEELGKLKEKLNSPFPVVSLSLVLQKDNIEELPAYVQLGERLNVDDALILDLITLEPRHKEMRIENKSKIALQSYQKAKAWVESSKSKMTFSQFTNIPYLPPEHSLYCRDPWTTLNINIAGEVSLCCYSDWAVGNIFKQSIDEIWNNELTQHFRATVNTDHPLEVCRNCPKKKVSEVYDEVV